MTTTSDAISGAWQSLRNQRLHLSYVTAEALSDACEKLSDLAPAMTLDHIGDSREGRPICAFTMGDGPIGISVKGNAHADEPAGVVTALLLVRLLNEVPAWQKLKDRFRFHIIPSANPDGLSRNRDWVALPFDFRRYFLNVYRDLPRDDVEFGYAESPDSSVLHIRPENVACARFFDDAAPIGAHLSLHSIVFTGGAWFLVAAEPDIEAHESSLSLICRACEEEGIPLHDEDRGGQKGFFRIRKGFHSTPTVEGMRAFFQQSGNGELVTDFRINSMQYVMKNCNTQFAAVSELPYAYDKSLANMAATEMPRADLEIRRGDELTDVLNALSEIIHGYYQTEMTPDGQFWLEYYQSYLSYRRAGLKALTSDLDRYSGKMAALRDLFDVNLATLRHRVFNAAAAYRLSCETQSPADEARSRMLLGNFDARFEDMNRQFDFQHVSLETQVRLQLSAVLAGLNAAAAQESRY